MDEEQAKDELVWCFATFEFSNKQFFFHQPLTEMSPFSLRGISLSLSRVFSFYLYLIIVPSCCFASTSFIWPGCSVFPTCKDCSTLFCLLWTLPSLVCLSFLHISIYRQQFTAVFNESNLQVVAPMLQTLAFDAGTLVASIYPERRWEERAPSRQYFDANINLTHTNPTLLSVAQKAKWHGSYYDKADTLMVIKSPQGAHQTL